MNIKQYANRTKKRSSVMKKRIISVLLSVVMLATLLSSLMATEVMAATEITNTNPAITAIVGEKVDLTAYSVEFDGDNKATAGIAWKDASGKSVTEITPDAKGVTKLTASANGKSKTIYLVAKEKDDAEYVLFEADFSKYTSVEDLKANGFVMTLDEKYYTFTDGTLVMGNGMQDYTRLILPEWLGDFGDYSITTEMKMVDTSDTGRWFGLVYRIKNLNKEYYPYYHMCIREKTTVSNGIEFAERTSANVWNVAATTAGDIVSMKNAYHTINVKAFEGAIQHNIDGSEYLYVADSVLGATVAYYEKGMVGMTMNLGRASIKNIRVAVQPNKPDKAVRQLKLINNSHEANNLINPIANVQSVASADEIGAAGAVYAKISEIEDLTAFAKKCNVDQVLPTFVVDTKDELSKLDTAMNESQLKDANIVSTDSEVLAEMRKIRPLVRTGLLVDLPDGALDSKTANEIRLKVRSAPATFCVIPVEDALYASVDELQELAVAVWVLNDAKADSNDFKLQALKAVTSGANGIISTSASELTKVINEYFVEKTMTRTPVMIGHRGNPSQAPENSLSGFIKAYENGADVFEVDVEITKDGEIVIMHDDSINRTTNYTGKAKVGQMTLAEIKQYKVKAKDGTLTDEAPPSLREVLEYFADKDCKIFVEFKGGTVANIKTTCDLIKEYKMEDRVDVISFNPNFLTLTQKEIPGMSTGYLHGPTGTTSCPEDALDSIYASLLSAQNYNSSINPSQGVASTYYMQAATDRGITVWPWTYNAKSNNSAFFNGCDGVTTDDMQWVTNMSKYISASDIEIGEGLSADAGVKLITYGNTETEIGLDKLIVKIIEGDEFVKIEDGKLVGVKLGSATVMYGYAAKSTDGTDYVLYTQPTTVNVVTPVAESEATDADGGNGNIGVIIGIVVAVIVLIGGGAFVFFKKKK